MCFTFTVRTLGWMQLFIIRSDVSDAVCHVTCRVCSSVSVIICVDEMNLSKVCHIGADAVV